MLTGERDSRILAVRVRGHHAAGERGLNHLVAGAVSGAIATGATAPLELVKTVLQSDAVQPTSKRSTAMILKDTFKSGGTRACFRGLAPSLTGIIPHSGLYFALYAPTKRLCGECGETGSAMVAAMSAGAFANVVTNPIWVVKSKMSCNPLEYPSILTSFRKISAEGGFKGFTAGMGASILGVSHVMVQFPLYERLKKYHQDPEGFQSIVTSSIVSKIGASATTYPLEVIRTRLQTSKETGWKAAMNQSLTLWKSEGTFGFFRGFSAGIQKAVPATVITLFLYEKISQNLDL